MFPWELLDKSPMYLREQLGVETISNQRNRAFNDNANAKNLAEWSRDHWIRMEGRLDHIYTWDERKRAIKKEGQDWIPHFSKQEKKGRKKPESELLLRGV